MRRSRSVSGPGDTLAAMDLARIPDDLLCVPTSPAQCSLLLEALWDALPDPLALHLGSDRLQFRPTRSSGIYLEAAGQSLDGIELDVLVPPTGWVLVPWAKDAHGVDLEVQERVELADRIQGVWDRSEADQLRALLVLIWAVHHRRLLLKRGPDRPEESEWLRHQLCHYAAAQEPGESGEVAAKLVAGGWHATPRELLATARALTA